MMLKWLKMFPGCVDALMINDSSNHADKHIAIPAKRTPCFASWTLLMWSKRQQEMFPISSTNTALIWCKVSKANGAQWGSMRLNCAGLHACVVFLFQYVYWETFSFNKELCLTVICFCKIYCVTKSKLTKLNSRKQWWTSDRQTKQEKQKRGGERNRCV